MLFLLEDFISHDECSIVMNAVSAARYCDSFPQGHCRSSERRIEVSAYALASAGGEICSLLGNIRTRALETVNSLYNSPLVIEFSLATEMQKGDSHVGHADNERRTDDGTWVPNHTPFRHYTTMLYLNDGERDYRGGCLEFPLLGQRIMPRPGLLVGFRCDHKHFHAVPAIESGVRYALSMWYSKDHGRKEHWFANEAR